MGHGCNEYNGRVTSYHTPGQFATWLEHRMADLAAEARADGTHGRLAVQTRRIHILGVVKAAPAHRAATSSK